MKRSREVQIVLNALECAGIKGTEEIRRAIMEGLKSIRKEKFAERMLKKASSHAPAEH